MAPVPEVHIAWHQGFGDGRRYAKLIHQWLRPENGLGPSINYRISPRFNDREPKAIEKSPTVQHVLVLLVSAEMVIDADWRKELKRLLLSNIQLDTRSDRVIVIPVAMDRTAFGMPEVRDLNFIRPGDRPKRGESQSSGVPLASNIQLPSDPFERTLLKQLTDALCQRLREQRASGAIRIFISHAKEDLGRPCAGGTGPAKTIRDYVRSETQLDSFYDENDIPFASRYSDHLEDNLDDAHAMIAVHTERYASRPWCRYEVSEFRRPFPLFKSRPKKQFFGVRPCLVVEAISPSHYTRSVPEFGNCQVLAWDSNDPRTSAEAAVMLTMRNIILAQTHRRQISQLALECADVVGISWRPDPISLSFGDLGSLDNQTIVHPGLALPKLEITLLKKHAWNNTQFVGYYDYRAETRVH